MPGSRLRRRRMLAPFIQDSDYGFGSGFGERMTRKRVENRLGSLPFFAGIRAVLLKVLSGFCSLKPIQKEGVVTDAWLLFVPF